MGNCLKNGEKINEHSNVQRRLRIGIGLKKGDDGNFHFGLEGGYEKKKDKDFSKIEGEKKKDFSKIEKKENSEISIPEE